jgi:L-amino acid N-acyltransferase YncA
MSDAGVIRAATPDDLEAITAIYAHAVRFGTASFEVDPPTHAEMLERFRAIVDKGFPYLVAERNGQVLGYAYANAYRPRPAYRFTVEDSIYVHPDHQGQGIGRALLEPLIAACTALGLRQMIGVIGDSRSEGSIALHRSLGFEPVGIARSVGFKHGRWLDQVLMQKTLGAGDTAPPDLLP